MKRIIFIGLILALAAFCLAGCGGNSQVSGNRAAASPPASSPATTQTENPTPSDSAAKDTGRPASSDRSGSSESEGDIINITEKMYVAYINDIYTNPGDYLGKTIKIQGMCQKDSYEYQEKTIPVNYVYRVGPGCCGNDGSMCGFEFTFDGNLPENNDWIEAEGVLVQYEEDGISYLVLRASSVTVMTQRGAETVS